MESPDKHPVSDELLDEMDAGMLMLGRLVARHHQEDCDRSVAGPRMIVLKVLADTGALKQGDLAALLGIKAPATTSLIDALERDELVERTHDADDRRITLVQLTEAGKTALTAAERQRREHMRRYLSVLPEDDIRTLIRIQRALISAIVEND